MSGQPGYTPVLKNKLQAIIVIILVINTVLLALVFFHLLQPFTGSDLTLSYKEELGRDFSNYNYRLAIDSGVIDIPIVQETLAEYSDKLDAASSGDELVRIIFDQGRRVQEIIFEAADTKLREDLLSIVNKDDRVRDIIEKKYLYIRAGETEISIFPEQLLGTDSRRQIETLFFSLYYHGRQNVDIVIEGGKAELIVPQTLEDQIQALNEDLNSIRLRLHEHRVQAGLAEMVGPGITLYVYDAGESRGEISLVHDADIRDIINELLSAGAQGISVGGQRLTATSPIRCSGPLIMVNYRQIPTNPVVIQAVGDPDLLISGLKIIISELETKRGLVFEINRSGFIKLPAYEE